MKLHRDASNRLTASCDVEAASYRGFVERIVREFRLAPLGERVDGLDEVFQDFAHGDARVALEWDHWMGFQVVAKSAAAEPLVEAIAAFLGGG